MVAQPMILPLEQCVYLTPIPLSNRLGFRSHQREEKRCNCKLESLASSRHKSVLKGLIRETKPDLELNSKENTNIQF